MKWLGKWGGYVHHLCSGGKGPSVGVSKGPPKRCSGGASSALVKQQCGHPAIHPPWSMQSHTHTQSPNDGGVAFSPFLRKRGKPLPSGGRDGSDGGPQARTGLKKTPLSPAGPRSCQLHGLRHFLGPNFQLPNLCPLSSGLPLPTVVLPSGGQTPISRPQVFFLNEAWGGGNGRIMFIASFSYSLGYRL